MADFQPTIAGSTQFLRRQRDSRCHSLEQLDGDGAGRVFNIGPEGAIIGRASDAVIQLTAKNISRHHATLKLRGTDCIIADNDSHNGIFLNSVKIHSAVLRDGDILQLADSIFMYHED